MHVCISARIVDYGSYAAPSGLAEYNNLRFRRRSVRAYRRMPSVPSKNEKNVAASAIFFIASFLSFIILIRPSFRLFSLPRWASAAILTAYLTLFILYYIFSIGKRSLLKTAGITIFMIPLMVLHYGSILTLCGQPKLYSALLFAGSTIFIAAQALIVKGFFVKASPKDRLFRMILYIAGQFFVTAGFSLMVV